MLPPATKIKNRSVAEQQFKDAVRDVPKLAGMKFPFDRPNSSGLKGQYFGYLKSMTVENFKVEEAGWGQEFAEDYPLQAQIKVSYQCANNSSEYVSTRIEWKFGWTGEKWKLIKNFQTYRGGNNTITRTSPIKSKVNLSPLRELHDLLSSGKTSHKASISRNDANQSTGSKETARKEAEKKSPKVVQTGPTGSGSGKALKGGNPPKANKGGVPGGGYGKPLSQKEAEAIKNFKKLLGNGEFNGGRKSDKSFRKFRTMDGKNEVEAHFVDYSEGQVTLLRKDNGEEVQVAMAKLSKVDQQYIRKIRREQALKRKKESAKK